MKHFTLYNLIIAFIAITTISCTKETIQEDTDIIKDTTKRNFFELSQESISLEKEEKTISIDITTDNTFSIKNESDWISIILEKDSTKNGVFHKNYKLILKKNESESRNATVIFEITPVRTFSLRISQRGRSLGRITDSLALVALYNSTHGKDWINNANWLSDKPTYSWYGINCTSTGMLEGTARVEAITLINNNLSGTIPKEIGNMDSLKVFSIAENKLSGEIPEEVFNHKNWIDWCPSYYVAWQKYGYKFSNFDRQVEYNTSEHGKVILLNKASRGKGVNIIITGDGFPSSTMGNGGEFETILNGTMDNIFETEPFKSYKEYFNIYMVKAVSRQRYISDPHYSRDTYYGITLMDVSRVEISGSLAIKQKISSLIGFDISNCTVVMVVNHDANMGCGGKNYYDVGYAFFSYSESFYKDNKGYKKHDAPVHEMGHAFAGLVDEYAYGYSPSAEYIQYWQDNYLTLEKNLNKSIQSDPKKVPWAHFIGLPGYEMVGVFSGADFPQFYRSEQNSIMKGDASWFNAVSREIIVKRIIELSGMQYSFEDFLRLDKM
ncbi:MAG: hypothetical protein CVU11_02665 [Bacteroidetes bacterium HGW-Bacteroidetes-6]|jgi:hypothetical protein|nr:MAG: hypothetical protein CVU12_10560 [Bacteroidetes bacterium HGW-Bacteroidetes-7]PKP04829.1 MAG: hypothetical protein CVU11_02665 [Bacteroidetes bacterium HGW-Bacteroidetes-6]